MMFDVRINRGWVDYGASRTTGVTVNGVALVCISKLTSRSVWSDKKRIVVKVDRDMAQGQREAWTWSKLDDEDKPFFATMLAVGDGYIVQEYVPLDKEPDDCDLAESVYEQARVLMQEKYPFLAWDWQGWPQFGVDKRTGTLCIHDYPHDDYDEQCTDDYEVNSVVHYELEAVK